jgi:hypothetical protein
MRIRPVHTWWLGVGLFTPSILIWGFSLGLFIYKGMFNCPFDWHGITHVYLPLFAAVVGLAVPVVCLRLLRHASWRVTRWAFAVYVATMLTWAAIDIRHEHYQMGGHDYPNGPLVDGHRYYWHVYYTWYFIPYRWIEHGINNNRMHRTAAPRSSFLSRGLSGRWMRSQRSLPAAAGDPGR